MTEQLTEDLQLLMKISYLKLMTHAEYVNPSKPFEDSTWDFTIQPSDLPIRFSIQSFLWIAQFLLARGDP